MNSSYLITVSREGSRLYGGMPGSDGGFTVFEMERRQDGDVCRLETLQAVAAKGDAGIGVVFTPAFPRNERQSIMANLSMTGRAAVTEYDFNEYLCRSIKGHAFALVMTADGGDIFIGIYGTDSGSLLYERRISGAGHDPRVPVLAECIWQKLISDAPYLDKQKDFADVLRVAADFIVSGKAEMEGEILLEGEPREFFICRSDAEVDNSIDHGSATLLAAMRDFRTAYKTDDGDTVMVLSAGLAGNKYFEDMLRGLLPDMIEVDDAMCTAVLNNVMNSMNDNPVANSAFVADGLPRKNISVERSETSIKFNIVIPDGFIEAEAYRNGKKLHTLTAAMPEFTDTGLEPANEYTYTFVLVYTDDMGRRKETRGCDITVGTMAVAQLEAVRITVADGADKATLKWENPKRGEVKIFVSDKPLGLNPNDRVEDINSLNAGTIPSLDTEHIVKKDFCGQRFYLPVTVSGGVGIAGNEVCVSSMVPPRGVRTDSTAAGRVKVVWLWDGVPAVRIKWTGADGNEVWRDIECGTSEPEFEIPSLPKANNIEISVAALFTCADGKTMLSAEEKRTATVTKVKVNYIEAKSEAKLFTNKDKYSLTLQADSEPPCDLYVLIGEGSVPLDLTNFRSHLTISHAELAQAGPHKFTLQYRRMAKNVPLYFRVIPADVGAKVKIVPEVKSVK